MSFDTDFYDIDDPEYGDEVRTVWENVFVDVTFYRRTAESRGEPYDPLWVEWEDEARGVLGLSDAAYVDESYQIVDDRGGSSTAVTSASKSREFASRPGSEADD